MIRRYELTYEQAAHTGVSRLISMQEYGSNGGALPAYTFQYGEPSSIIPTVQSLSLPSEASFVEISNYGSSPQKTIGSLPLDINHGALTFS